VENVWLALAPVARPRPAGLDHVDPGGNRIIDQEQYTILVTAVIGSAVVPTLIAQKWFQPVFKPIAREADASPAREEPQRMHRKILIANDGSEAGRALRTAISLASVLRAELHMISVEQLPRFPATIGEVDEEKQEANRIFDRVIERARLQAEAVHVKTETHVVAGHAVPSIVEFHRARRLRSPGDRLHRPFGALQPPDRQHDGPAG
jgi:hypothetical protein